MNDSQSKICTICRTTRPLTDFGLVTANKDGLNNACRECHRARARRWNQEHPGAARAAQARHREKNKQERAEKDPPLDKKCSKCKQTRSITEFHRDNGTRDGYDLRCKACAAAEKAVARARDPEKFRAWSRACLDANREAANAASAARYAANRERVLARMKARYDSDPTVRERMREVSAAFYQKNRERTLARAAERRAADPEHFQAIRAASHKKHPEHSREAARRRRTRLRGGEVHEITLEDYAARLEQFAGYCAYCWSQPRDWDHFIPIARGGPHAIENLVPACMRCNRSKNSRLPFVEWQPRWSVTDATTDAVRYVIRASDAMYVVTKDPQRGVLGVVLHFDDV